MAHLVVTDMTAAILALFYLALTFRVISKRGSGNVSLGDGGGGVVPSGQEHTVPLLVACRSHANFAEYVPLCLILLGLVEMNGTRRWFVAALAVALIVGRLLHPVGMGRKIPNPFRAGGVILTLSVIVISAVTLIAETAMHLRS